MTKTNTKDPNEIIMSMWHEGAVNHHEANLPRRYVKCIYDCLIRRRNFIHAQQKSFGRVTDAQQIDLNDIEKLEPMLQLFLKQ